MMNIFYGLSLFSESAKTFSGTHKGLQAGKKLSSESVYARSKRMILTIKSDLSGERSVA